MKVKKHLDPVYKIAAKNIRKNYNNSSKLVTTDNSPIRIYNFGTSKNDKDIIYNSGLDEYVELAQESYIIELCRNKPYLYKADKYILYGFGFKESYERKGLPFDLLKMRISISQTIRDIFAHMCCTNEIRNTFKGHIIEIVHKIFCLISLVISAGFMIASLIN